MGLSLENVDRLVSGETHLAAINLELPPGSRNVLLGRTLAGKTSLLRIMAGLDRPSHGRVRVNGRDVTGTSVRRRGVAMVYQQFINYPSLTVFQNIASPLKMGGCDKSEIDRRVRAMAAMLHLEDLLDRLPAELSGGQQQRTAIARALVKEAELLLLDEPLVNLDYKLREELREELREIFAARRSIVVYTTTEPTEALLLGGDIVVLDQGRVLQTGATTEVYRRPATLKVAEVFSDPPINCLPGIVADGTVRIGGDISWALTGHLGGLAPGRYRFGFRAHHLFLQRSGPNDIEIGALVALSEINGSETFIHVHHGDDQLVVQETGIHGRKIGSRITLYIDPARIFVYDELGRLVAAPDQRS